MDIQLVQHHLLRKKVLSLVDYNNSFIIPVSRLDSVPLVHLSTFIPIPHHLDHYSRFPVLVSPVLFSLSTFRNRLTVSNKIPLGILNGIVLTLRSIWKELTSEQ